MSVAADDPRVVALARPVYFAVECADPRYHRRHAGGLSVTVTVRAGWG